MLKKVLAATAVGLALAATAGRVQQTDAVRGKPAVSSSVQVVDNFRLTDETGRSQLLYARKDAPAVVLVMQGNGCPIVRNMTSDLRNLRDAYAAKGVEFMMINSNIQDTREAIAREVADFPVNMPVLKDDNQLVGLQLGAQRTSEVFVVDPKSWKVIYRGPLNDLWRPESQGLPQLCGGGARRRDRGQVLFGAEGSGRRLPDQLP